MVKLAFENLGYTTQARQLRHVSYGVVSLSAKTADTLGMKTSDNKNVYSMSGRKGIGIKIDDLLKAVEQHVEQQNYAVASERPTAAISAHGIAVGAIKYFMLRYNPKTDIVFDYAEALSLEGNTGPYIQYAYARAAGILERGNAQTIPTLYGSESLAEEEQKLVSKLYLWPEVCAKVVNDLNVNVVTNYAFELANTFNTFYEAHQVLKAPEALKQQRLVLVYAFKAVLGDVLALMGIEAPEKM